jgi:hypothetical protein
MFRHLKSMFRYLNNTNLLLIPHRLATCATTPMATAACMAPAWCTCAPLPGGPVTTWMTAGEWEQHTFLGQEISCFRGRKESLQGKVGLALQAMLGNCMEWSLSENLLRWKIGAQGLPQKHTHTCVSTFMGTFCMPFCAQCTATRMRDVSRAAPK